MLKYVLIVLVCIFTAEAIPLPEASQVALEAGRTLLPSRPMVDKVKYELGSIRTNYKAVSTIHHQPAWVPGELLGTISPEQVRRLNSSQYGPVEVVPIADFASRIYFTKPYNAAVLSRILQSEFGIRAEPNAYIGRSQTITYNVYRKEYTFYQGSGDCPSGCTEKYYWVFKEYPDSYIRLLRQSSGTPPDRLAVKYTTKPFAYAPTKEEETQEGEKRYTVQGAGILAAKYKFQL